MTSTVSFGNGAGTIDAFVTTGGTATTVTVVAWDAANHDGSFIYQDETQAPNTTVEYVISGNFVSNQCEVALANMTNGESITANYGVYQGTTTQVNATYTNQAPSNFAVYGSGGVTTINSGSGPDTITNQFINLTGTVQDFSLLVDVNNSFIGGLPSNFTISPYATLDLSLSGTFDVNGLQPIEVIYNYATAAINMASITNDGMSNSAQVLPSTSIHATDFAPPSTATVIYGTGPNEIIVKLTGLDSATQFAIGNGSFATGALDTNATGSTSQTVEIFGTFTGQQVFSVYDYNNTTGNLFTGNEDKIDSNSGVIVQSISFGGTTITPNATITAAQFQQGFTIAPTTGTISMTPYAAPATSGLLATPLETDNWNPGTQLASFFTAYENGNASIAFVGDSTTSGIGADPTGTMDIAGSFPSETAYWLNQDGVAANNSTFLGNNGAFENQITLTGNATQNILGIAGDDIQMVSHGDSFTFTPNNPITGNVIQANVLNNFSGDTLSVTVNGTLAAGTITIPTSGTFDQFLNDTITLPSAQKVNSVTFTVTTPNQSGSSYMQNAVYFEGAGVTSTAQHSIEIYNDGASGIRAEDENYQYNNGNFYTTSSGVVPATAELDPSLVVIDLGINDFIQQATINPTTVLDNTIAAIGSIISVFQAHSEDVILASPTPFDNGTSAPTQATQAAFVAALETLAVADHVGMIDLNDTYGASLSGLAAAGGISSNPGGVHPSAQLYANIGQGIGSLIAAAVHTYA